MSRWGSRFEEHPIFTVLEDVNRKLNQTKDLVSDVPAQQEDHSRLRRLASETGRRLESVDPELTAIGTLNGIHSHMQKVNTHLQNFIGNKNAAELDSANLSAENALVTASNLPMLAAPVDLEAMQESVISVRRSLAQHARHAQEEAGRAKDAVEEVEAKAEELKEQISSQKARLDKAIENTQERFTAAEAERGKQLEAALTAARQQLDEIGERFRAAQETRQQAFTDQVDEFQDSWTEQSSEMAGRDKLFFEGRQTEAKKRIAALGDLRKQAEDVVGIIGQTGMVGGYQKQANVERWTRWAFQIITITSLIAFASVLVWGIPVAERGGTAGQPVSWVDFAHRMVIGLAFAAIAAFASREASKHGERERRYRKVELEIASVGPFLASLPEPEQNSIRKEFAERVFGHEVEALSTSEMQATTNGLLETVQLVVRELLDIAKTK